MMPPDRFPRRVVERSFRKFDDLVGDLLSSKYQTWGDALSRLLSHCETDPVMQVVTSPLKADSRVDAQKWWNDAVDSVRGMVGSGEYSLPSDDDERTALLYQVLLLVDGGAVNLATFSMSVYGVSKHQEMVNTFNQELVRKFTREVSYRLNEVAEDIGDQQEVSREAIVVFHHHDYSTTITGGIQGSNVATGNANLSHSTASVATPAELASEIRSLKSLAADYARINREAIESLLDSLAAWAEAGDGDREEIVESAKAVAEISPTSRSRMSGLVSSVGSSMAGSIIVEALKVALVMGSP